MFLSRVSFDLFIYAKDILKLFINIYININVELFILGKTTHVDTYFN